MLSVHETPIFEGIFATFTEKTKQKHPSVNKYLANIAQLR